MNAFDIDAAFEPNDKEHRFAGAGPGSDTAAQHGLDVFVGVIGFPGLAVRFTPFVPRHRRVVSDVVVEVVFIQVLIHRDPRFVQPLVILRAGKRRQVEKLEHIDRQLAFDDLDIVDDRLGRVPRKAENVAAIGNDAGMFPCQQHLSVIGDLVLAFLGAEQAVGIDILKPDENTLNARPLCLFDKVRQLMTQRIDLDDKTDIQFFGLAKVDQFVEDDLPVLVSGKIVISYKERMQALSDVGADDLFNVLGRTPA